MIKYLESHIKAMEDEQVEDWHLEKEKSLNKQIFQESWKEEGMWRLKSRSTWLKVGDQNTFFFHK